ncbi:Phage tail tape measure protein [uncultured Caudovirales phage]|uniref:Phage tail tape measure protein n=1 Tax=uncultured Caudovirales phage TaxID=2100421 RepID=A0A6J5NFG6_9CAUD|nr:Phage tail tape measure protein [uncultured Caudovirales phage]
MSDVNANIGVHIDTSAALAELKNLQRQISTFHSQISKSSATAAMAQKNLQTNLLNAVNATGQFRAQMGVVRTSTESFTNALEKNKLSMRDYFRYAGGASKSFGKLFKSEFDTIGKVAEERVKKMQTQYIKMGRDASGAMRAMSITPNTLNMQDYATKTALAAQKQALFNQLVKQGSTNLLNFGKNTQWAGRQLMVGFSVPLLYIGSAAGKVFMDLEQQALKFKRVYGDMFTTSDQTNKALKDVELLAKEFTKYGVAVSKTMEMAASAAAMGKTGAELTAQVAQATRLAVLGNVEQEQALETTTSLTNAFGIAAEDLAKKIDFLNSVENQTVTSIEDLTIAIPKAGPVVKQLGGDVEDLAFFLTAMKEGGINASEGANALKSGLASLINPTKKAAEMLNGYGVNIKAIVEGNQGDIKNTVIQFAQALDTLAPLDRSRAIEQLFGKFQFARLSTLFQNITKEGTQANRVLELSKMEVEELAILSERELKTVENAVGTNFKEAIESLKLTIAPIGKTFLEAVTPVVKAVAGLLEKFNGLGDGTKKFIVIASTLVGIIGPTLLMAFGLVANGAANIIKLFLGLRSGFLKLGGNSKILAEQTNYLNSEQLEAATVATSLNQAHNRLTQSFVLEASAVKALRNAYIDATVAATNFAIANPGMMMPGFKPGGKGAKPKGFASGTTGLPGPKGAGDIIPILGAPGEAIIPADVSQDKRFKPLIEALVSGDIKGYEKGTTGLTFDGKEYNAKTAPGAKNIKSFLDELIKNPDGTLTYIDPKTKEASTFTAKRLREVFDYRAQPGKNFTVSDIKRSLDIGSGARGSGRGTSRPEWISKLVKDAAGKSNVLSEQKAIEAALKDSGSANLSQSQKNNLYGLQASHIVEERDSTGKKVWRAANIVPDPGYINNYINTVKGKLGKELLAMTDDQLKSLNIDKTELKKIASGTHPTTANAANTLRNIAQYQIGQNPSAPGIYQAQAVVAGIDYRMKNNVYQGGLKTLAQMYPTNKKILAELAVAKGEVLETATGKKKTVTGQTGKAKPAGRNITASPRDTRVIDKKSVRRVFPYGMKGMRVAGAIDGFDGTGTKSGLGFDRGLGTTTQDILKQTRLQEKALKENIAATQDETAATKAATTETKDSSKQTKLSKENIKAFGAKANVGVGALSGLTIAASFAGGKVGEMAQKIMPFIFGLQGILMLLPLLMNPLVGLPLAIGAVVAGIWLFNKKQQDAIKAEARLVDELYATTKKMQSVGEISGKVGASQLAARKRESSGGDFSFERKGIKFGSAFLQSEVGKADIAAFEARFKAMPDIAMKEFSLKLASYVSDGVIDAAQAASIADQVGIEFQDKVLGIKIQGQLQGLLTSNGKDITKEPFEVRIKIAEETISQFDNLVPNLQKQLGLAEKEANALGDKLSLAMNLPISDPLRDKQIAAAETLFRDSEKRVAIIKNSIKQNAAFAAGMASQAYEGIQAQIDGIEVSTSKTLDKLKADKAATKDLAKQALIQKDIDLLEKNRVASVSKLRAMNDRVTRGIEQQLKLASATDKTAFFTGSAEAVKSRFKGTKQEGDANMLLAKTAQMGQSVVRAKIEAVVSSGQFGPGQASGFINLFANDDANLKKTFDTFLNVQGIEDLNKLQSILGGFEDQELAKDIMIKMSGLTDKEFQAQYSTLELLQQMDNEEINIELVLKDPGALAKITSINTAIENIPDVTQKSVELVLTEKGFSAGGLAEISANWEYFQGLPSNLRKTALQTFTTLHATIFANNDSKQEWARQQAEAAAGRAPGAMKDLAQKITYTTLIDAKTGGFTEEGNKAVAKDVLAQTKDIIGIQAMIDKMLNPKGGGGGTGTRNTFLDSILDKLRRTRDASVDTTKGLEELRRVMKDSAGNIEIFNGLDQALSKLKAPQEFIDFIASLDPKGKKGGIESLATYLDTEKLKKGIVELTKDGKTLLSVFREGVIGDFESDLRKATNGLIAQKTQFILLNAIVKDNKLSAEMLADANFALALSTATTEKEVARLVAAFKAQKAAQEDLAMTQNPLETLQNKFSEVEDKINKFFSLANEAIEAKFARRILAGERAVEAAQKEVEKAQDNVEKIQKHIDGIQAGIDKKQREIEMSITRPIEAFQDTISSIEDTINTQFDKPIAVLQEESSDLANDLTLLDRAADAINKKYDAQEEALNKISEINKDLIAQEKQRISLADTLTSGDISAAAQAVQDMRGAAADSASGSQMDMLKAARQKELDNQRTASGLTRVQIEQRQFEISQQIFKLEEGREVLEQQIANIKEFSILPLERERERLSRLIRDEEDKIYNITNGIGVSEALNLQLANEKLATALATLDTKKAELLAIEEERQKELDHLDDLKLQWTEVKGGIAAAELETINLQTEIGKAIELAKQLAALFASMVIPGGGVVVPPPGASPEALAEAADAAKAEADAAAAAQAAADEATAAALAAADAVAALEAEVNAIMAGTAKVYEGLSTNSKVLLNSANPITSQYDPRIALNAGFDPERVGVMTAQNKSAGGMIMPKYLSPGGMISPSVMPRLGSDIVPAMLTPGEFVMSKYAVGHYGVDKMKAINNGSYQGERVYNYNLSVNVKSDANPDDIARVVMTQIRQIDSQRIRTQRA